MNTSQQLNIGFIGAGNMASALAGGLIQNGFDAPQILLSDINEDQLETIQKKLNVSITTSNETLVANCDVIVLAVKPQIMETVITPLASQLLEQQPMLISIAAGITLSSLESWIGGKIPAVRCMPNTPALVSKSATGLFANEQVTAEQKKLAENILDAVGISKWLNKESDIDAVTALSGSGPAYYFLVMEAMINAGKNLGLSEELARELTLQTATGAALLAQDSLTKEKNIDVAELRRRVTSPGGTTEAAIKTFQSLGLENIFEQGMQKACDRSKELAGD